ncbi:GGDEF domain-containing protein [Vibrio lentus]|nr:GGDEF domain-containing protein [Vibrio lentus]
MSYTSAYYYTKLLAIFTPCQKALKIWPTGDLQLTGLANRWSFERWASRNWQRIATPSPPCISDIDDFKSTVMMRHDVGDSVFCSICQSLRVTTFIQIERIMNTIIPSRALLGTSSFLMS